MSTNTLVDREKFVDDWIAKYKPVVNDKKRIPSSDLKTVTAEAKKAEENAIVVHGTATHNVEQNQTNIFIIEEDIGKITTKLTVKNSEEKGILATIRIIDNERFPESQIKTLRNSLTPIQAEQSKLRNRYFELQETLKQERAALKQNETTKSRAAANLEEVNRIILELFPPANAAVESSSSSSSSASRVSKAVAPPLTPEELFTSLEVAKYSEYAGVDATGKVLFKYKFNLEAPPTNKPPGLKDGWTMTWEPSQEVFLFSGGSSASYTEDEIPNTAYNYTRKYIRDYYNDEESKGDPKYYYELTDGAVTDKEPPNKTNFYRSNQSRPSPNTASSPSNSENNDPPLPPGWQKFKTNEGNSYYYNETAGKSQWELPTSNDKQTTESAEETNAAEAAAPAEETNAASATESAEETNAASATAPAEETSAASANTGITYEDAIYFTNDKDILNIVYYELSDGTRTFTPPGLKEGWKARGYYVRMAKDYNATTKKKKDVVSEKRNSAPAADRVAEENNYERYKGSDKQEVKYIEENDTIYYKLRDGKTTYTPPGVLPKSSWTVKLYYYLATNPDKLYIFSDLPTDAKKTAGGHRRTRRRAKKTRKSRRRVKKSRRRYRK